MFPEHRVETEEPTSHCRGAEDFLSESHCRGADDFLSESHCRGAEDFLSESHCRGADDFLSVRLNFTTLNLTK